MNKKTIRDIDVKGKRKRLSITELTELTEFTEEILQSAGAGV